jgi:hypothetical protein
MSGTNDTKSNTGPDSSASNGSPKAATNASEKKPALFLDLLLSADGSRRLLEDPEFLALSHEGE